MVFKVDGIEHYTYNPATKDANTWPYDAPQFLLMNVAIQGDISSSFTESAMVIDYVRVYQEATASIPGVDSLKKIKIYPNPINDKVSIQIHPSLFGVKATVYSLLGAKVTSFVQDSSNKEYDFSKLKKGIYFIKFDSEMNTSVYKVLKMWEF